MRIIKFRAWIKEKNKIFEVDRLDLKNDRIYIYEDLEFDLRGTDIVYLMQYTGLKDKNGKEIYEGDLVKHIKVTYEVIYSHGCFGLINIKNSTHTHSFGEIDLRAFHIEITGNIYENPELLKSITNS